MSEHVIPAQVTIVVDDREYHVADDVTVAAAMMNLGLTGCRRSVGGEPRAPLCGMGICHECRVEIDGVGARRSCLVRVSEGLRVRTAAGVRA